MTCANTFFTNTVVNIWNSLPNNVVLCDILINSGNIKILFMMLKFTEPEFKVYITRTSYVGYQYFVSFVFLMRAQRQ